MILLTAETQLLFDIRNVTSTLYSTAEYLIKWKLYLLFLILEDGI